MCPVLSSNVKNIRGEYNKGYIKRTENQRKKHVSQMTEEELEYLNKELKSINLESVTLSYHLEEKAEEIDFKMSDIIGVLKNKDLKPYIVEYNERLYQEGRKDRRVLLRDIVTQDVVFHSNTEGDFTEVSNLCFVISLESNRIVTVYWNIANDSHKTMNWNRYDKDLEILK